MMHVIRNPEWKSITVKVIIVQILLSLLMFMYISTQVGRINLAIVDQNASMVGHLLLKYPESENEIIHDITQGAQTKAIIEGKRILSQYGYTTNLSVHEQPVLAGTLLPIKTAAQVLIFVIPILVLIMWEYRKIFSKIRAISYAAEQVVERQFAGTLPENMEGDFGLLGRSFNAMAGRLTNSLEQLHQEKKFLRNLLSDISHQLKTPLSSLILFNENLLRDHRMKEEMKTAFLTRSRKQLDRMDWLIVNLLKMARVEAGGIQFRRDRFQVRETIDNVVHALRPITEPKKQVITIVGGEQMAILADEEWFKEALMNVIKNAIEYSPEEGRIEISLEESNLFHTIMVRDHGEGIRPEDIPHIFKRFYRGKSHSKPEGIGIGLSLTKSIIEGQDGMITAESIYGKGSEFRISFFKRNEWSEEGKLTKT
ncbi:HAMP domain-containing histidine kinase [Paenibacillus polymyxa]|uniref:HAMP domain-containing sensor histidine kinase n=1 Tax=Paenibacillus polymyxa TaxID=1406 RepID=UPI001BE8ADD1|nr:HAMP domain-containing sensor histidine kinase [Paenibacillus polymyxa]MBT2286759.1 HAMP domain-containing histidine kinase [Paenibacillus polymyxa]